MAQGIVFKSDSVRNLAERIGDELKGEFQIVDVKNPLSPYGTPSDYKLQDVIAAAIRDWFGFD